MSSRRDVVTALASSGLFLPGPGWLNATRRWSGRTAAKRFRVRAITAGVTIKSAADLKPIEAALQVLGRAKQAFTDAGYEVQTTRIATNPVLSGMSAAARRQVLPELEALDQAVAAGGSVLSIGPVRTDNAADPELPEWAAELVTRTSRISFSVVVASPERGIHRVNLATAAEVMVALSRAIPGGGANFRFAASANIPAGTPFFPVAYHGGADSLAIGLESPLLLLDAFTGAQDVEDGARRLRTALNEALAPVERLGSELARREGRVYLGIDPSPAPGMDSSIGAAIEALTHVPFGGGSTLDACAAITAVLKAVQVKTCGYAGLMLPVLEDPVLAKRADEQRYGLRELLLYSSVCGTGLDVVPIPGDTSRESLIRVIGDVAALSARLRKPLSARLFLVPGKKVGETAHFDDPLLTDSAVFKVE